MDEDRPRPICLSSASQYWDIVAFDSGTQPITADTMLTLLPPYKQFTIADERERSRKFDQTPAGRARTELSHARTAVRNANANAERVAKRLANLRAADNGSAQARDRSSVGKKAGRERPNGSSRSPSGSNSPN